MTNIAIPEYFREQLPSGIDLSECEVTRLRDLRGAHHVEHRDGRYLDIDDDAIVVVLPGWTADDGNAEVEFAAADSGEEAAQEYVDEGDWGDRSKTAWIDVSAWRRAYALVQIDDDDEEVVELMVDHERHIITIEAEEPECVGDHEHDWRSPYRILGGLQENPGVWGHGGGVIIREVCAHCGRYRVTDTWSQNPSNGQQGLQSVSYEDADDDSRDWIAQRLLAHAEEIMNGCGAVESYERDDGEYRVTLRLDADSDVSDEEPDEDGRYDNAYYHDSRRALERALGDRYEVSYGANGVVTVSIA